MPLRSSTSLSLVVVSNRRISVPLREAEATTLPGWFSAMQAISLWWALMVKGADDVPGLVLDRSWRKQYNLSITFSQTKGITMVCCHHLQPAVNCRTCDQEKQVTVCPDWDINHTGLEEMSQLIKLNGEIMMQTGLLTFRVISGVKLKKLDRIIWEAIHIDPVL